MLRMHTVKIQMRPDYSKFVTWSGGPEVSKYADARVLRSKARNRKRRSKR